MSVSTPSADETAVRGLIASGRGPCERRISAESAPRTIPKS
jgi:hypothetical protein